MRDDSARLRFGTMLVAIAAVGLLSGVAALTFSLRGKAEGGAVFLGLSILVFATVWLVGKWVGADWRDLLSGLVVLLVRLSVGLLPILIPLILTVTVPRWLIVVAGGLIAVLLIRTVFSRKDAY